MSKRDELDAEADLRAQWREELAALLGDEIGSRMLDYLADEYASKGKPPPSVSLERRGKTLAHKRNKVLRGAVRRALNAAELPPQIQDDHSSPHGLSDE